MRTHRFWLAVLLVISGFVAQPRIGAVDTTDTKLLSEPAISATHIAFIYAGDLYSADLNGGDVRRLTSDDGVETNPVFSPDGSTIAFSTQYGDNLDVFTVPVTGGAPTRLTWHPGNDVAQGFTPDGRAVLFVSTRAGFKSYHVRLYTVPVQGGVEEPLPIPAAARAAYSPDGARIAYNPFPQQFLQWKQYRGGMVAQIWLYTSKGHAVDKIPQPASRANDTDPMWLGDIVYFRSDRNGEFNLFAFNTRSKRITQLTRHADFPVLNASAGNGRIIYEQAGSLHILETQTGRSRKLTIGVATDLPETRPRVVKGARWIRDADLSPTGARAVFEVRGEIVIFDEAWRINRDYFYAANMHGVDWTTQRDKYAAFLPHLAIRADLNRILQWMSSELSVSHHGVDGGDALSEPKNVAVGLLGADYEVANGRYRLRKVYDGLNWDPQVRAPLTEPGVNAKAGEYILAVNGKELRPPTNIYSLFENTPGRIVELTLGPNADGTGSRMVQVVPVNNEASLRRLDWVEGNLKNVENATGNRVAYVYVPDTHSAGYTSFNRYFYSQADRDGIILDGRFNSGGVMPDYFIDTLRRPLIGRAAMRYGEDLKIPLASIQGPKAMLIDETAGSGGDMLPWMFRKHKMGPLIGKRTWGGMASGAGMLLMDGGTIAVPNAAFWTPVDGWTGENEGVPPDIEVEQTPAAVIAGRDPQLEKAIEVVMTALRKNPPVSSSRPAYPVKGRTLRGTVR